MDIKGVKMKTTAEKRDCERRSYIAPIGTIIFTSDGRKIKEAK